MRRRVYVEQVRLGSSGALLAGPLRIADAYRRRRREDGTDAQADERVDEPEDEAVETWAIWAIWRPVRVDGTLNLGP